MDKKIVLEIPTPKIINSYVDKFEKEERYYIGDQAIIMLFDKFKKNTDIKEILLKISVINDLYSTNIFGTFLVAKHIHSLNIDNALENGDPKIVNKIAKVVIKNKVKNFYSFASKYCNWHNQSTYPIYDRFVDKILKHYRDQTDFYKFNNSDLKDYAKFIQILQKFKDYFNLNEFDFKKIDKFLWMYGKEVFKK